jgi:hypothetical protein
MQTAHLMSPYDLKAMFKRKINRFPIALGRLSLIAVEIALKGGYQNLFTKI